MNRAMQPIIQRGVITEVGGAIGTSKFQKHDYRYTVESMDYPSTKTRRHAACAILLVTEKDSDYDLKFGTYSVGDTVYFVLFPDGSGLILRPWYPETYVPGGGE